LFTSVLILNHVAANNENFSHLIHTVAHVPAHVYKLVFFPTDRLFHRAIPIHTESGSKPQSIVAQTHNNSVKSHAFVLSTPHIAALVIKLGSSSIRFAKIHAAIIGLNFAFTAGVSSSHCSTNFLYSLSNVALNSWFSIISLIAFSEAESSCVSVVVSGDVAQYLSIFPTHHSTGVFSNTFCRYNNTDLFDSNCFRNSV
jgi:hypothetical protein